MPWKTVQNKKKVEKRIKLALIVLGLIILVIILGNLVRLTQTLFSPWKLDSSKAYLWDGQFNINLVLRAKTISVFSYNPTDKKVTLIKIPDETYLEVAQGFGSWQIRAIYDLGKSSKIEGNTLLKQSVSTFLGVPIDGYMEVFGQLGEKEPEEIVELLLQSPFNIFMLLSNLKSDLTLWELIRLKFVLSQVRFDKVKTVDLLSLNILDQQRLADGSIALISDPIKIDSVITSFYDSEIQNEHLSIAVFNATSYPLLSKKAGRLVTNIGGNVIIATNAPSSLEKTKIVGQPSNTLKRLIQIFGCDNCDKIELKDLGLDSSRGQINIFLGEDFYSKQ